jgi:hypothetical protein
MLRTTGRADTKASCSRTQHSNSVRRIPIVALDGWLLVLRFVACIEKYFIARSCLGRVWAVTTKQLYAWHGKLACKHSAFIYYNHSIMNTNGITYIIVLLESI